MILIQLQLASYIILFSLLQKQITREMSAIVVHEPDPHSLVLTSQEQ